MAIGWISLHRKIFDNPLWLSEKFTKAQAWVDLLLLANHKPGYILVRGIKISIDRGQTGWSENSLSARWKWSRTKVKNFLKMLKKEQQIIQQVSKISSIITIVNYDQYQEKDSEKSNRVGHLSDVRPPEIEIEKEIEKDIELKKDDIRVPLKDGTFFIPDISYIETLTSTYTNIDMNFELKKITAWCVSNPSKRKTLRGVKKFMNGWMDRANTKAISSQITQEKTMEYCEL